MADQVEQLAKDAVRPKKVKTETAETERHSLPDQIAAAKFVLGQAAGKTKGCGVRFRKFIPPSVNGQVSDDDGGA